MRRNPGIKHRLTKASFCKRPVRGKISIVGEKQHVAHPIPVKLYDLVCKEADRDNVTLGTLISNIYKSVVSITVDDIKAQKILDKTADNKSLYCYLATFVLEKDYCRFKLTARELGVSMRFLIKLLIRKRNHILLRIDENPIGK